MSESVVAKSPQILALQRTKPPPPSCAASARSGRELVEGHDDIKTTFVPETVYAFCTSPEHTVTACLANSTVDSPVRMIAEHLFGLGYGSFQLFTGDHSQLSTPRSTSKDLPTGKGVKAWLAKLNLRPRKAAAAKAAAVAAAAKAERERQKQETADEASSQTLSDSDFDPAVDDHWKGIRPLNDSELAEVRRCGQWRGAEPSDMFLNIFGQTLLTLEKNVLNGLVSPPLMGSSGAVPLTIISHTADIVQHYAELIVNAEREIFFTTNVWEASDSSRHICNAIRELSKRVMKRGGEKIVMKLMYDRGVLPQEGGAHQIVDPKVYTAKGVELPAPSEIPGVLLEVQNYHVHPVGSFHQKSMVIDRKVALLSSNNVQSKGDVGLMVQFEGPIVQSMYDTALLSWWTTLNPRPPLLYHGPEYPDKLDRSAFQFGQDHPAISRKGNLQAIAERTMRRLTASTDSLNGRLSPSNREALSSSSSLRASLRASIRGSRHSPTTSSRSVASELPTVGVAATEDGGPTSPVTTSPVIASPMRSKSPVTPSPVTVSPIVTSPVANGKAPSPAASSTSLPPLPPPALGVESETTVETPGPIHLPTTFTPVLVHKPHDPFPIALVNRTPRGRRGEGDVFVPQNQAWMSGFKFAQESIFIQTPTFSARPMVAAALDAVRRGVLVEIYADLGFSEQGEISQDGVANQAVAAYMYKQLDEEQRDKLRICWYVAKGEMSPRTSHTCHIKIMIIDSKIAVQGNGRQDMSSWYHAQEINVLVDSPAVCAEWRHHLDTNQDTGVRGRVGHDGVWRDSEGESLPIPEPTPTLSLDVAMRRMNTSLSVASSNGGSAQPTTPTAGSTAQVPTPA